MRSTTIGSSFTDVTSGETHEADRIFQAEIATFRPEAQEKAMEIITSWMEEGIKKGLEQGLEQGLERGLERGLQRGLEQGRRSEASLVLRQLERRLGAIPGDRAGEVLALSTSLLEGLGEALLDFSSPSDLDTWLDAHRVPGGATSTTTS